MCKMNKFRVAFAAILTMLSASMYAENEPVKYIDSDGLEKYVTDYTVLTGDEDSLTSGWYVVNQPALSSHSGLMINGDVRIILCDECVWSINEVVMATRVHLLHIWVLVCVFMRKVQGNMQVNYMKTKRH